MAYGYAGCLAALILIGSGSAFGANASHTVPTKAIRPEVKKQIQNYQKSVARSATFAKPGIGATQPDRPFTELESAGYLFFSANTNYNSKIAKQTMAKNLPADVTLVIFTEPGSSAARIQRDYQGVIEPERLKIVEIDDASDGFWARDGLPIPIWDQDRKMDLVGARYYHGFEPDETVREWFGSRLTEHRYFFEGGNFVTNDRGDCLTIDNDLSSEIPDDVFRDTYGCKKLLRFPHEKGIGHADESLKFVNSDTVITDSANYEKTLVQNGFKVIRVPRPQRKYETYVNSLLVNGTIYVPVFNQRTDDQALQVYRDAGFTVVPIETISLANNGLGSLHCITMTYPKVPFEALLKGLGGREL